MRGGMIFVRDDIGYRGGIHMKQYKEKRPVLVIGGSARAFLGEYMAGGLILILGRKGTHPDLDRGIGSGIHGGKIIIRGDVSDKNLGVGAKKKPFGDAERKRIAPFVQEFATFFDMDAKTHMAGDYTRIGPASNRPFANKYTWE
jgi:glutamate synthase domain-containing protein 3